MGYGAGGADAVGVHLSQQMRRWVADYGQQAQLWQAILAEAEALAALATWAAEQEGVWPEILSPSDDGLLLAIEDLAHPLLPVPQRVGAA